tara:strand:+ start:1630 stop:2688 length:1059 start_codon:yes stop_codon:yes gene_type:complete
VALRTLSLCSGYGGLELGLELAGVPTSAACYVEREAYAAANLVSLMEKGFMGEAPVWSDLTTFDANPWRGAVDLVTAGFPCQPFSAAGKRKHTEDERWLWGDIDRILRELRPGVVFLENVPGLLVSGMGPVLGTLASLGFDAEWGVLRASDAGAPHRRARIFVLGVNPDAGRSLLGRFMADPGCSGPEEGERWGDLERTQEGGVHQRQAHLGSTSDGVANADRWGLALKRGAKCNRKEDGQDAFRDEFDGCGTPMANASREGLQGREQQGAYREGSGESPHGPASKLRSPWPPRPNDRERWELWRQASGPEPGLCRGSDGLENSVDRLRLLGNGVVPQQAAYAFKLLWERMK